MTNPKAGAALAAVLWGFTYILTTEFLPAHPLFIAAVRALGGGVLLLVIARESISREWWLRISVLGTLNSGLFFALLFVSAIRLPGGIAAIFQALAPLLTLVVAWPLLGRAPTVPKLAAVGAGAFGVALIVMKANASLDAVGILAAMGSVGSIVLGGVLVQKWGRPCSLAGFTAWQLIVGGVELVVLMLAFGDLPNVLTPSHMYGLAVLAAVLTALPFLLWFRGIQIAGATNIAPLILLTPMTAFLVDVFVNDFAPSPIQLAGFLITGGALLYCSGAVTFRRSRLSKS